MEQRFKISIDTSKPNIAEKIAALLEELKNAGAVEKNGEIIYDDSIVSNDTIKLIFDKYFG